MTVSWAVSPKKIEPPKGGLKQMGRVVFITHLSLFLLIGTVYLVSEYNLDRFFWLFAASMLVSVLGHRLASDWGLSGLTGLAVSGGLFLLFVTDGWGMMFSWLAHGNNALQGLIGTALLSVTLLAVSKAKFFGFLKLIAVIGPVTMASVNLAVDLPQLPMDAAGRGDIPSVQGSPLISNQHGSNRPLVTSPAEVPKEWWEAFLDAGKDGLARDTRRAATSHEVGRLKEENEVLKKAVAEVVLDNQRLKRSLGPPGRLRNQPMAQTAMRPAERWGHGWSFSSVTQAFFGEAL